jgi:hypothetical protein
MRFNQVGTIIGQRGTGKSLFLLGSSWSAKESDRALQIPSLIDTGLKKGMKVLVIDTLDHPAYKRIPVLKQRMFKAFTKGVARLWLEPDKMRPFVDLINRSPHMNNSFIVFEDAGKYTEKNLPPEFKRLIMDSKQRNIDILFMYHCFIDTPANIFTKADYIQLFKTEDSPRVRRNNLRLYDKVEAAHREVNTHPSKFYGKFIDTRTS